MQHPSGSQNVMCQDKAGLLLGNGRCKTPAVINTPSLLLLKAMVEIIAGLTLDRRLLLYQLPFHRTRPWMWEFATRQLLCESRHQLSPIAGRLLATRVPPPCHTCACRLKVATCWVAGEGTPLLANHQPARRDACRSRCLRDVIGKCSNVSPKNHSNHSDQF